MTINISESGTAEPKGGEMVKWSPDEQAELAFCRVECSRDNKKGTSQNESSFWTAVRNLFNLFEAVVEKNKRRLSTLERNNG